MSPQSRHREYRYLLMTIAFLLILPTFSTEKAFHRQKRFIYFPNGGIFKFLVGFAMPIKLGLKQSLAWGWNFQFQYAVPQYANQTTNYPPIVSRSREKRDGSISDRSLAYSALEAILNKNGFNGRACLLRSICENAALTLHHEANGLLGHLLHIVLTPDFDDGEAALDSDSLYMEAKKAGLFGVDCASLYPDCPQGDGLLDIISLVDE